MPLLSTLSRAVRSPRPPVSSGAELVTTDGRSLPLLGAVLRAQAQGGIARLVLEQTFANPYDAPLHVTYRMPLPADGAVSGYAFVIAGRTITGRVDARQAAREQFERAVAEGKTAALLEQDRADIFTQAIGNLPPREQLVARITVDQRLAWLPEGEWELRCPTVIGPRYVGIEDSAADARDTVVAVAGGEIAARIAIEISIGDAIVAGRRASSPSHPIVRDAAGAITLGEPAALDRDIVVRWPVADREVGIALDTGARTGEHFGLLTIVPPAVDRASGAPYRTADAPAIARDLTVLLDTSGSMRGAPLEQAQRVVALLIESLSEADRIELIEFNSAARRYTPEPVFATAASKREAIRWVRSRSAGGGTEMGSAVRAALVGLRPEAQRQVVLVTDGYVGGEERIVQHLRDHLPKNCRLHVVGVGAAVNRSLAAAMARAGRGAEVLVGLDEDAERGAKRLLDRTRAPVLTSVEILGSALVRQAPAHVPDVFAGAPVIAALQLRPEGGELVVRGDLARDVWVQRICVPAMAERERPEIAALFARERVADLEMRWTIGDAADLEVSADDGVRNAVDWEIEAIGVKYQIATRRTSWVAVDEASRVDDRGIHEVMPQALPYGTSAESFGLRPAAAPRMTVTSISSVRAVTDEERERRLREEEAAYLSSPPGEQLKWKRRVTGTVPPRDAPRGARAPAPTPEERARQRGEVLSKTIATARRKGGGPAEGDGPRSTVMSAPEPDPARSDRAKRDTRQVRVPPVKSVAPGGAGWRVWLPMLIVLALAALLAWLLTR